MQLKKMLSTLGLAAAALLVLAGCGSGSKSTGTSSSNGKVELTYLTYDGTRDAKGKLMVQNMVDQYEKSHPNVKIKIDLQAENNSLDFLKKLDLLQMSGNTGDMIHISSYRDYATRATKGFFYNLDKFYKADGGYDKLYAYPAKTEKGLFGVPYEPSIYVTFINKKMLDAAGESLPQKGWTWDDYAKLAKKLAKGSGSTKVYGSYMHTWPEFRREGLFNSLSDNPYIKANGKSNLTDPQFAEWLEYMHGLEKDGSQLPYSDAKATNMQYMDVFLQGKAAMMVMGTWAYDGILDTTKYPHDFQTVSAPFPVWKDGKAGVTQGGVSYLTVGAKTKHPKEAYEFIRWASDKGSEGQNIFPSTKGGNIDTVLKAKVGSKTNLLDLKSALSIWDDPDLKPNMVTRDADKFAEVDQIFNTQTEKYILGSQDIKATMKAIQDQGDPIINKK